VGDETLEVRIAKTELPVVMGDSVVLTQLYQNLLGNALKFTADKPPVLRLTCERDGDDWILGVRDNGIGIAKEQSEKIFAPFKRLHGRGEFAGTGIGLATCRKAVERHGGRIFVES
jgi:signal transduction histidine kinase